MPMPRTFKSRWFTKRASKLGITDADLCEAMAQVRNGQAEDLGGGVYKKRLSDNDQRGIVLAKGGEYWIYEFIFTKQDKSDLKPNELKDFRTLAKGYGSLKEAQLKQLLDDKDLVEICHENQDQA
ncbi:type II toxin-antitoxin system RelE/ParE family toxin [Xanthomonas axonopodis pv. ricini]